MVNIEKLDIPNQDITLEAEFFQSISNQTIAVLICHPHPQYGGNFRNNVVQGVFSKFISNDTSILIFNFRGVGRSTGSHTGGSGEISDVEACIDFLINEKNVDEIFICGYSYGAAIGCSTVNYSEKIIGFAAISFPWDEIGLEYKKLSQTEKPKLFLQGDRDDIAYYSKFQGHYDSYKNPKEHNIISGADHLYWGYEEEISTIVVDFFNSLK